MNQWTESLWEKTMRWGEELGMRRMARVSLRASEYGPQVKEWVDQGHHAEMHWYPRSLEKRLNPDSVFAGARSAVVVLFPYWPLEDGEEPEGDLWAGVARYARGEDYHYWIKDQLRDLGERIEQAHPGCRTRAYTDTGPLLERELAQRAGLGYIGKSTNLLHPEDGSWFFIGEILTNLIWSEEPAVLVGDLCGSCTACLDACPTNAFESEWRLDSRKCISYWTIEHRGSFPESKRRGLGEWVFGCDVCQEVCPVNFSLTTERRAGPWSLSEAKKGLSLSDLLEMTRPHYTEVFRRSPMKRAKLEGLKRNAAVAMGNSGQSVYVEALGRVVGNAEEVIWVREQAAWALGQIGGTRAREVLRQALEGDVPPELSREIKKALAAPS